MEAAQLRALSAAGAVALVCAPVLAAHVEPVSAAGNELAAAVPLGCAEEGGIDAMALDPQSGDVYVTTGDALMRLSEAGQVLGSLPTAGAVSPTFADGGLWVAFPGGDAVAEFDPTTLEELASYPVPRPESLAGVDGTIFVDFSLGAYGYGLARIVPGGGVVPTTSPILPGPYLVSNPAQPGQFLSWSNSSEVAVLSLSGENLTVADTGTLAAAEGSAGLAYLPDGSGFLTATPSGGLATFGAGSLSQVGPEYPGVDDSALAVTASGGGLVVGGGVVDSTPEVEVFGLDDPSAAVLDAQVGPAGEQVVGGGIAVSGDARYLYVLTAGRSCALEVLNLGALSSAGPANATGGEVPTTSASLPPNSAPSGTNSSSEAPSGATGAAGPVNSDSTAPSSAGTGDLAFGPTGLAATAPSGSGTGSDPGATTSVLPTGP